MSPPFFSLNPTEFAKQLGGLYPIIQAPMAGGITTPALVAAVARAGALGSLACGMLTPKAMREKIAEIRALGCQNFSVNLFVLDEVQADEVVLAAALKRLEPFYSRFGLTSVHPKSYAESTQAHLEVALELRVPVVSFTFDMVDREVIKELHAQGTRVIGTATTVDEAVAWEDAGADAICAQGFEAGGHRGGFSCNIGQEQLGCIALIPRVRSEIGIPIIAAGGIMDGSGIAACLALGATAVQLGTAFLCADEAGTHPVWKQQLLNNASCETALTVAFSGRPARGLRNRFMDELALHADDIPPYPIQNALTAPLRTQAALKGDYDYMSLWAGQAHSLIRFVSADEIIRQLVAETSNFVGNINRIYAWSNPNEASK